ncbi:class II fumarate hydratase [Colwellia sp. 12G3]|uniref:class II fumarate hydratase n=1 Tax=Colwellia sp. 12G3 TaxID=2058299 RepID=UPI000C324886|nr:class II fumarate hydratase [Colwellia sp. 12G3]PKI18192.1 aspartate ammonia-lyase [Colwellia sp. 12G3]
MDSKYRIENDSLGEVKVPLQALYGAQTQRALDNFKISNLIMPRRFIQSLGLIKAAAAKLNGKLGFLEPQLADAVYSAAMELAEGKHFKHFPIDVFQTGSATSTNMNANEVIASLASQQLKRVVHPNDEVNCSQSSNDVIPTAIHLSAQLSLEQQLLPSLVALKKAILKKERALGDQLKTGRTHLMDAMPLSFAQELSGWRSQISLAINRITDSQKRLCQIAQGGTAVGTGVNAPPDFADLFAEELSALCGIKFCTADNLFAAISSQDTAVELSGQLKTLAVALLKIANDLRWMNSGPLVGLAEISLKPLQPGSSIMPGKINPVLPEAVAMAAVQVIGNDTIITLAGGSGNFQLNVMLPVIAYNLLLSIELLTGSCQTLMHTITDFTVNAEKLKESLARNPILITALNKEIGYNKAAEIAKRAYVEKRSILDVAKEMTDLNGDYLAQLLDPKRLI